MYLNENFLGASSQKYLPVILAQKGKVTNLSRWSVVLVMYYHLWIKAHLS